DYQAFLKYGPQIAKDLHVPWVSEIWNATSGPALDFAKQLYSQGVALDQNRNAVVGATTSLMDAVGPKDAQAVADRLNQELGLKYQDVTLHIGAGLLNTGVSSTMTVKVPIWNATAATTEAGEKHFRNLYLAELQQRNQSNQLIPQNNMEDWKGYN